LLILWLMLAPCAAAHGQDRDSQSEPAKLGPQTTSSSPTGASDEPDVAALRAETTERLKAYEPTAVGDAATSTGSPRPSTSSPAVSRSVVAPSDTSATTTALPSIPNESTVNKPLPVLLHDRLRWLNEYDEIARALLRTTHTDPSPERQVAEAKAELLRLQNILSQAQSAPETLLPPVFRGAAVKQSRAAGSAMKDAIEEARNEFKEWKTKLETVKGEIAKWDSLQKARRTERDRLFQRVSTLSAKSDGHESAVTDAQTTGARRLARERLINFQWEARVESLRLKLLEAQLALEAKLADVRELNVQIYRAHVQIAERSLEPMQARYRAVAEDQMRDLNQAATTLETKAHLSGDPLERFRARWTAELLALEVLVLRSEQALAISPPPSYDDQKTLADRAEIDFTRVKELVEDGNVSRLDAIRLNNEFRRIGPERDRLLKNELATVEAHLQYYENALTDVELDLLQDSLHDRFEHDLLRERLSTSRWADGEALSSELERKHRALLLRRRSALEKLSVRASHTLQQVQRRLNILDQEYGFIRTSIFWVRDQDTIGRMTITQAAREFSLLVRGLARLVQETVNPNLWGQPSAEFMVTLLALLASPIALWRLHRLLGALIKRDLPAPHT
jgi:potassium efflux system protein